jgi:DNA invertase Pin-like site-specific DNA recombinase
MSEKTKTKAKADSVVSPAGGAGVVIGYARVSTEDQNLDLQINALKATNCHHIYQDHGVSGTTIRRPGLDAALQALKPGDTLLVWKLDRLGRSLSQLVMLIDDIGRRGASIKSVTEPNIDTTNSAGKLILGFLSVFAAYERDQISERTREGLKAARRRGSKLGRPQLLDLQKLMHAKALIQSGETVAGVAATLGVSVTTLNRRLRLS